MRLIAGDEKKSMLERGLNFSMILEAPIIDFRENPAYDGQMLLIVKLEEQAVVVPCKPIGGNQWVMVTAFPSRKETKRYIT